MEVFLQSDQFLNLQNMFVSVTRELIYLDKTSGLGVL